MKRKALLINSWSERGSRETSSRDITFLASYLRTRAGGAWLEEEILRVKAVGKGEIHHAIQSLRDVDYGFILIAGNGEFIKGELPWREMRVTLASGDTLTERELNPGTPRCAIILDATAQTILQPSETSEPAQEIAATIGTSGFRDAFDQALQSAERGFTRAYALNPAQALSQSFTRHLVKASADWLSKNQGCLYLGDAVETTARSMQAAGATDLPTYLGGRRRHDFPFGITLK